MLESLKKLPLWMKGCLGSCAGCLGCWGAFMMLTVLLAALTPGADRAAGPGPRPAAQAGQQSDTDRKSDAEARKEEAAAKKAAEAKEKEAASRRLKVDIEPENATVTLFLAGAQVDQRTGDATFEGLKRGPEYTVKVNAPSHETKKVPVKLPRDGALSIYLSRLPDLQVLSTDSESDEFAWYATGQVRNNSERTYSYVQVEIALLGADGNLVGSTLANVNNLRPGQVWKFKALVLDDNAERWRVEDVTGF